MVVNIIKPNNERVPSFLNSSRQRWVISKQRKNNGNINTEKFITNNDYKCSIFLKAIGKIFLKKLCKNHKNTSGIFVAWSTLTCNGCNVFCQVRTVIYLQSISVYTTYIDILPMLTFKYYSDMWVYHQNMTILLWYSLMINWLHYNFVQT